MHMEISVHEPRHESPVVMSVRDRIVTFHDRYLKTNQLSERIVSTFEQASSELRSKKAREIADRLRPKMNNLAKNAEIATAAGDFVIGLIAGGIGIRDISRVRRAQAGFQELHGVLPGTDRQKQVRTDLFANEIGKTQYDRPLMMTAIGGGILALRPVTRLTDAAVLMTRRPALFIARQVDALLLKREAATSEKHVFVGTGKA